MSNFSQGCEAGIQYAIRRSDFDVLKTCFDAVSESPAWVAWRLPLWTASECWYMTGELPNANISVKKFLFRMAAVPKTQDAAILPLVAEKVAEVDDEPLELRRFRFWYDFDNIHDASDDLLKTLESGETFGNLSAYELDAARLLYSRIQDGGYVEDRKRFLAAMFLIGSRRIETAPSFINKKVNVVKKTLKSKPVTVNLPWWVYDLTTDIGLVAMEKFLENHGDRFGLNRDQFVFLHKILGYTSVPRSHISYTHIDKCKGFGNDIWLPFFLKKCLSYRNYTAKGVKKN